jgi:hypothetical protein
MAYYANSTNYATLYPYNIICDLLKNQLHHNIYVCSGIYKVKCHTRNLSDIGQTGSRFELRFKEHPTYYFQ